MWATIAGLHIQSLCVRLALSTGWHLARCYREEYDKKVVRALWVVSELGIIASDVPEVIGTALALKLIFGFPTVVGVFLTSLSTFVFLGLQHFGVRKLEAFMGSLVAIMSLVLGELVYCDDVHVLSNRRCEYSKNSERWLFIGVFVRRWSCADFFTLGVGVNSGYQLGEKSLKKAFKYNVVESGMALTVTLFINFAVVIVAGQNAKCRGRRGMIDKRYKTRRRC